MAFYTAIESSAIRVTGTDRLDFVQGQVSQNVKVLPIPGGARSMILNVKGQIEFDVRIYRQRDEILIQTEQDLSTQVMARLQKYIVFDDVKLEDVTDQIRVLHVSGDDATELISSLGFSGSTQTLESEAGTILISSVQNGFDLHVSESKFGILEHLLKSAGAARLEPEKLEVQRIISGFANAHLDSFTGMLPQECGLLEGVSFKKGCYVGQEIMARLDARGHSNKKLVRVNLEQQVALGTPVMLEAREVGRLGHVVAHDTGFTALAVVRIDALEKPNLLAGGLKLEIINS